MQMKKDTPLKPRQQLGKVAATMQRMCRQGCKYSSDGGMGAGVGIISCGDASVVATRLSTMSVQGGGGHGGGL
jgi:hypothetical protein